MPSTPMPPTSCGAPPANPSGWPPSRSGAAPCSSRVLSQPGFAGVMAYAVPEARWLVAHGVEDVFVAYPSVDRAALAAVAASADGVGPGDPHHRLARARGAPGGASTGRTALRVAVDVDASLRMGPLHLGVRRSPLREPAEAVAVARAAAGSRAVRRGPDVLRRPDRRAARLLARRAADEEALGRLAGRAPSAGRRGRARGRRPRVRQRRGDRLAARDRPGPGGRPSSPPGPASTGRPCSTATTTSPPGRLPRSRCRWCGTPRRAS